MTVVRLAYNIVLQSECFHTSLCLRCFVNRPISTAQFGGNLRNKPNSYTRFGDFDHTISPHVCRSFGDI